MCLFWATVETLQHGSIRGRGPTPHVDIKGSLSGKENYSYLKLFVYFFVIVFLLFLLVCCYFIWTIVFEIKYYYYY